MKSKKLSCVVDRSPNNVVVIRREENPLVIQNVKHPLKYTAFQFEFGQQNVKSVVNS